LLIAAEDYTAIGVENTTPFSATEEREIYM
jgi:hypothetical protein